MATYTYEVLADHQVVLAFRADFTQASSPILIGTRHGDEFDPTPFQVADARHRPTEAAKLLNRWCRSQGGEAWARGSAGLTLRTYRTR